MAFIEVKNLSHIYNADTEREHRAVDRVSLSIEAGEFVAILGTNGSGKSTLAKHFNGLLLPTSGEVRVAGFDTRDEEELWQARQQVGMVFQNPDNQLIAAVVEDDIAFGPENLGVPPDEIRKRVHEALELVGMTHFRKFAPHLLSGGQKQRIAIAGALAMHTRALVLDEPTAMLDPAGREEVLQVVKRLHEEQGITVIYITHFMEEAAVADRTIVMEAGRIVADDEPRQIFAQAARMRELGLDVPVPALLAERLRRQGVKLPQAIMTQSELVRALSEIYGKVEG